MTTIYIGPFLVIPKTPWSSTSRERVCSNHCAAPIVAKPAKFCANCGGEVLEPESPIEVTEPLPLHLLPRQWTDFMWRPEYGQHHPKGDIWLPNRGNYGIKLSRGSEDVFTPRQLSTIDGQALLDKASRDHAEFVAAVTEQFDAKPFWEVGIVAYST